MAIWYMEQMGLLANLNHSTTKKNKFVLHVEGTLAGQSIIPSQRLGLQATQWLSILTKIKI